MRLKYLTLLALPFMLGSCNQKSVISSISVDFCDSMCKKFVDETLTAEEKELQAEIEELVLPSQPAK